MNQLLNHEEVPDRELSISLAELEMAYRLLSSRKPEVSMTNSQRTDSFPESKPHLQANPKPISTSEGSSSEVKVKSIAEALSFLDEAARDSAHDLQELLKNDFQRLRKAFTTIKDEAKGTTQELRSVSTESLDRLKERITDTTQQASKSVESSVRDNPWSFIGSAAVLGAIIGFAIAKTDKTRSDKSA